MRSSWRYLENHGYEPATSWAGTYRVETPDESQKKLLVPVSQYYKPFQGSRFRPGSGRGEQCKQNITTTSIIRTGT